METTVPNWPKTLNFKASGVRIIFKIFLIKFWSFCRSGTRKTSHIVALTYIGQRRNSITNYIETAARKNILIKLLLTFGIVQLHENTARKIRRCNHTRNVNFLSLRQHTMSRPFFEIDKIHLLNRCLMSCHNLLLTRLSYCFCVVNCWTTVRKNIVKFTSSLWYYTMTHL